MQPDLKAKWVKALRSGEYRQGREHLRTADGAYCCLGVLACIAGYDPYDEFGYEADYGTKATVHDGEALSTTYMQHIGLPDRVSSELIDMNDGSNSGGSDAKSFAEIADWIERNESI